MAAFSENQWAKIYGFSVVILLTVGTQLPFDRLSKEVDRWAKERGKDVIAQIGPTTWNPESLKASAFFSPEALENAMNNASAIVSHAGMGTILTALRLRKPILIMPRLASKREQRSDHQVATAKYFNGKPGIIVVDKEDGVFKKLDELEELEPSEGISEFASKELMHTLSSFINK